MPVSTLQNMREQQGVVQFKLTIDSSSTKYVNWRSNGSSLEVWAENLGSDDVEFSFDGSHWKTLPSGGVDVYRQKMVGFHYRRKNGVGSNECNVMVLTANPNPKPTLAVGQVDDGKVR